MFEPFLNIRAGGVNILFIGILTKEVLDSTKTEKVVGTFIDVEEAAREVGIICDNYRTKNTDMTILLTHIGIEEDRKLAALLNPEWGVDMIIGGHSHTFMDAPEYVHNIPIVQAGTGTSIIGRFDLVYDTWRKKITSLQCECVPIDENTAEPDEIIDEMLDRYKQETDSKYKRVITTLARKLTHPARNQETEVGNLYADLLQDESSFDIMLVASGSLRKKEFGPIVEVQDMMENMPFDDALHMLKVTGVQFKQMVQYLLRDEAWQGHTEFYQFSKGVHIVYRKSTHELETCTFKGRNVEEYDEILIALQHYHFMNFSDFFGIPFEEVVKNMKPRTVSTSVTNIVEEYFSTHPGLDAHVEGRITILD